MRFVQSVRWLSRYKLLLGFEDGSLKKVDLAPHLDGPIFEPLKDVRYFKTVRVHPELRTIVWDNDADFSPDFLYEIGVDAPVPAKSR